MASLLGRLDRWQQRRRATAFPIAVYTRFNEHNGARLAANISYFAFFSVFPLMLAFVTIVGFVADGDPELQRDLLDSAIGDIPVIGSQLASTSPLTGNVVALVTGLVIAVLGGLRMIDALAFALNDLWDVPMTQRSGALSARGRAVLVLVVFGGGLVASTALTSIASLVELGLVAPLVGYVASGFANGVVIVAAQKLLVPGRLPVRDVWIGSAIAGVIIAVLQQLAVILAQRLGGASDTYGAFAGIIGLLGFFHLVFRVLLLGVEVDVVRTKRLMPRSLMPRGVLTDGDRRAMLLDVARVQRDRRIGYAIALDGYLVSDNDPSAR